MKHTFIKDLKPDWKGDEVYLLKLLAIRDKKNGGHYLFMKLGDSSGDLIAMMWDNFEEAVDTVKPGDFVKIRFRIQVYNNQLQMVVTKLRKATDDEVEDPKIFFPVSERPPEQMLEEVREIIETQLENSFLKELAGHVYNDPEVIELAKIAPAAKSLHHAYRGGYLEHLLTLLKLAIQVSPVYPYISKDLVLAGLLFHDLGKLWELSYQREFSYSTEGRLLGHIAIEYDYIAARIREIPDFPDNIRLHLLHIILSHHGELEFGSPKRPKTPEALMVNSLDNMDAKLNAMRQAIEADVQSDHPDWTPYLPMFGRVIYKNRP
ncbi:MAG: phosphohydrolase [Acidobacteria bacterium]|nr:MAG: phosphohydrolase [Acidobacteriota bacterium]RLE24819.1 MAG: phosphohydrolase [Acidobacteriota bacterium]